MRGYPAFLVGLDRRPCVVVGGGAEAERKVEGLLASDALVTVIAQRVTARIRELAELGRLAWLKRDYRAGDLAGVFLVIAAGQGPVARSCIWEEAQAERALVNVMDDPAHCNFIAGSVVRRGDLTVAISTNGVAPAFAVRLRERLERELDPELGEFLQLMATLRSRIARRYPDFERRRALWYRLVDSDLIENLKRGRRDLAVACAERVLEAESSDAA